MYCKTEFKVYILQFTKLKEKPFEKTLLWNEMHLPFYFQCVLIF